MEEIKRILKMVEEKKITAEQANSLIQSIKEKEKEAEESDEIEVKNNDDSDFFPSKNMRKKIIIKVEARDDNDDDVNVNIKLPVSLIKVASKMIPKSVNRDLMDEGIDLSTILSTINELENFNEDIVNVDTKNAKVRIYID